MKKPILLIIVILFFNLTNAKPFNKVLPIKVTSNYYNSYPFFPMDDGKFIVFYNTYQEPYYHVAKYDEIGNLIWQNAFNSLQLLNLQAENIFIKQLKNGNYVCLIYEDTNCGACNVLFILDSLGNKIFETLVRFRRENSVFYVETIDTGFNIIVFIESGNIYKYHYNNLGSLLSTSIDSTNQINFIRNSDGYDIIPYKTGYFFSSISGFASNADFSYGFYKMDSILLNVDRYDYTSLVPNNNVYRISNLKVMNDNVYLLYNNNDNSPDSLIIIKTDLYGNLLKRIAIKQNISSDIGYDQSYIKYDENTLFRYYGFNLLHKPLKLDIIKFSEDSVYIQSQSILNIRIGDSSNLIRMYPKPYNFYKKVLNQIYSIGVLSDGSIVFLKIDSLGNFSPYTITGNIFLDRNNNCLKEVNENSIPQITVTAQNNNNTLFASSDNNGNYTIPVADTGIYILTAEPNINCPFFVQSNCSFQTLHLYSDGSSIIDSIDLSLEPTISVNCPYLSVDISSNNLQRCTPPGTHIREFNVFYVTYCNYGTAASPNTYIDITLDRLLSMNTPTIPYTNLGNNTFRFQIGNLDYLKCGNFSFNAIPVCDSTILGQTLCTEAHIYPDSLCFQPNYNGPITQASARCNGDSVQFKLKNIGHGNMNSIKHYIVIEDNVNRMRGDYQLPTSAETYVSIKTRNGSTYRIIAEQPDELPAYYGNKFATAHIEGCRPNADSTFTTGFVTQFPNYDGEPFRSVSCNTITGSFDPNEKISFPTGYAVQHFIEKNTDIEYQINFQNTGNDTAYRVVLVDTISPFLDINTIQPGVSSHTYQFVRTDSNVVNFVFNNIKLVDSLHNEPLSHGFVKYRIQQKPNNANGTKIYNSADIYFDYNAPIVTNKTMHTIGENFITINLINAVKNPKYNIIDIKVFPNPFRDQTQIILETNELKNPILELMDLQGKIVRTISADNTNTFTIERNELSSGIYLFKIMENKEEVASGKLVAQ